MIGLVDRYIGRTIIVSTLLVLSVVVALLVFLVVVEALPDVGRGSFDMYALIKYVVLSQPRKIYELFPVICLIGTIMGLSALALSSELVALRAAGIPVTRIVGSALKGALIFIVATVLLGEWVVPVSETLAQVGRATALNEGLQRKGSGLWLRDGTAFVNVAEVFPDLTLLGVNIYQFDGDARLRVQTFARQARYEGESWRLEDVNQSRIGSERVEVTTAGSQDWETRLTPEVVSAFAVKPEGLSVMQLRRYIRHLAQNRQDHGRYSLTLWQKLFMPLTMAIMVLLATPFVFRQIRSGGLAQQVFIGIMLGLVFVVTNRGFGFFALLYGLPPPVGALLPLGVFLAISLVLLRRAVRSG